MGPDPSEISAQKQFKKGWKTETIVIDPSMNIYFFFPFCWMAMTTLKKMHGQKKDPSHLLFHEFFLLPNVTLS